jgi:hypothetical protein
MTVTVAVPQSVAERLNNASVNRRWYPFSDDIIDWSVPLTNDWAYVPAGRSLFSASGLLNKLNPEDRSFIERWETTQTMRNVAHGEHLLMQGILALLWQVDQYDPNFRYLLHEVAEECQHMAMFNNWVKINSDIKTRDVGEAQWSKTIADFTQDLAVRLPEAFWVNVLLFEFIGDELNQAMKGSKNSTIGDDGRDLHPILVQIGIAHTSEEARHIAYARKWLQEGMGKLNDQQKTEIQNLAEVGAQAIISRQNLLPVRYSRQLEPYISKEEFDNNITTSPATIAVIKQLKKLLDEFLELEIIKKETFTRWIDEGVFD